MSLILSIIVCTGALIFTSCSSSPTSTAETYLNDMKDGNYKEMVDYLHFKKEITPEEKEQFGNMLEEKGKKSIEKQGAIKSYEITSEEISEDGTTAKVDYIIKHEDGKESSQSINLVNIDGKWLIDSEK